MRQSKTIWQAERKRLRIFSQYGEVSKRSQRGGLENRLGATPQGFESLPLRQIAANHRVAARNILAALHLGGQNEYYLERKFILCVQR